MSTVETLTRQARSGAQSDQLVIDRRHMAFDLDQGAGARAAIGLIVLASDQTIEQEFRRLLDLPGVGLYESRIYNDSVITPETLKQMEAGIATATGLILPGIPIDVVGYGCTSGAMVIGEAAVAERIREIRPGVACTTPMTAAFAAFASLGVRRLALLTPYVDEINQAMRRHIEAQGYQVTAMGSFNEEDDRNVARITPAAVREAARELGRHPEVEAVFVSCTNLRVIDIICELEAELGKPVTSSNHAMAWHCLRLAGADDRLPQHGSLFNRLLSQG